jgi:hypothetical protein
MILAIGAKLVEKGIVTREELETKKEKIMNHLMNYNTLMMSESGAPEEEMKKMSEVDDVLKKMAEECCFSFDTDDQEINRKLRENIIKERQAMGAGQK